jgi:hypothetical protein
VGANEARRRFDQKKGFGGSRTTDSTITVGSTTARKTPWVPIRVPPGHVDHGTDLLRETLSPLGASWVVQVPPKEAIRGTLRRRPVCFGGLGPVFDKIYRDIK